MILYIAGPCTGYPKQNYPAFEDAERRLTAAGYVCINPARYGLKQPENVSNSDWILSEEYTDVMVKCMADVERAEGMALLPGWRQSNGASKEHFRAICRGLRAESVGWWIQRDEARCIKWIGDPECVPFQGYPGDAGFDLTVSADTRILVDRMEDVPLGVSVELPPGMWALLVGRSSTIRRRGLLVVQAVIDNGYRGPLFAACQNMSGHVVELHRGERVAQLIPMRLAADGIGIRHVTELGESERGTAAFGSTGGFATEAGAPK